DLDRSRQLGDACPQTINPCDKIGKISFKSKSCARLGFQLLDNLLNVMLAIQLFQHLRPRRFDLMVAEVVTTSQNAAQSPPGMSEERKPLAFETSRLIQSDLRFLRS